jgi:hypothetical protein
MQLAPLQGGAAPGKPEGLPGKPADAPGMAPVGLCTLNQVDP